MKYTNRYGLPAPFVAAITNPKYSRGSADFSTTELTAPARIKALTILHDAEIEIDVSDRIWPLLGQGVHLILEEAGKRLNVIQEERLYATFRVDGKDYVVSGQADLLEEDGVLSDWKVTSVYSYLLGDKKDWDMQGNINALLYKRNGFPVRECRDVAILRDWSKGRANDPAYPQIQVLVHSIELMPEAAVVQYIEQRIRAHVAARAGELPECSTEERWERKPTWALMRENRKTAVRVLDTKAEAETVLAGESKGGYVQERKGASTRCESYCDVAQWCTQWQAIKPADAA